MRSACDPCGRASCERVWLPARGCSSRVVCADAPVSRRPTAAALNNNGVLVRMFSSTWFRAEALIALTRRAFEPFQREHAIGIEMRNRPAELNAYSESWRNRFPT
jgi:hypothetical protein